MKTITAIHHQRREGLVEGFRRALTVIAMAGVSIMTGNMAIAQSAFTNRPFINGEVIKYNAYYKWGILMPKAGEASLTFSEKKLNGDITNRYKLLFHSSGMVESVYSMRDTLESVFNNDMILQEATKRTNDDKYYSVDKLSFSYRNDSTFAHSLRYDRKRVKIDTTLVATGEVFDIVGAVLFLRSLDWDNYHPGKRIPFKTVMGRDVINAFFIYKGQEIIEKGNVKYRTRRFTIDIYDDAFTDSKGAADLWVGDDKNRIPIKIRAKLKIGAAEVFYKESSGLRYPLDCRVEVKKR